MYRTRFMILVLRCLATLLYQTKKESRRDIITELLEDCRDLADDLKQHGGE